MADWRAPLMSAVCYQDARAAIAWLERAFGFEVSMLIEDAQGNLASTLRDAVRQCRGDDRQRVVRRSQEPQVLWAARTLRASISSSLPTSTNIARGPRAAEAAEEIHGRAVASFLNSMATAPIAAATWKAMSGRWLRRWKRSPVKRPKRPAA